MKPWHLLFSRGYGTSLIFTYLWVPHPELVWVPGAVSHIHPGCCGAHSEWWGHISRMESSTLSKTKFLSKIQMETGCCMGFAFLFSADRVTHTVHVYEQWLAGQLTNIMTLKLSFCFPLLMFSCSEEVPWWQNQSWSDAVEALLGLTHVLLCYWDLTGFLFKV